MAWFLNPAVRLRPIPEMQCCLAYMPKAKERRPELYGLNLTSWLALSLCDGRNDWAIEKEFADARSRPLPLDCKPDAGRVRALSAAIAAVNAAAYPATQP